MLALTYDPASLNLTAADIRLGSIPSNATGWQLLAVVDSITGQIGIELYSLTPIVDSRAGSLVSITFHLAVPSPRTSIQLVSAATPNGQTYSTAVADSQGTMIFERRQRPPGCR